MSVDSIGSLRTRSVLLLALVFLAGAAAGAGVYGVLRHPAEIRITDSPRPIDPEMIPVPLMALGLSDGQKTQLHAIARMWRPKAGDELQQFRRRVGDLENGMFADMVCVLSPGQRRTYRSQLEESGMPTDVIVQRFQRVEAKHCGR